MAKKEKQTPQAYTEILELIRILGPDYEKKIPDQIMEVFRKKCDPNWEVHLDPDKSLDENELLEETRTIIACLYLEYWETSEERKEVLRKKLERNQMKYDLKLYRKIKACENLGISFERAEKDPEQMEQDTYDLEQYKKLEAEGSAEDPERSDTAEESDGEADDTEEKTDEDLEVYLRQYERLKAEEES